MHVASDPCLALTLWQFVMRSLGDLGLTLLVLCVVLRLCFGSGDEAALGVPSCSFSSFSDAKL